MYRVSVTDVLNGNTIAVWPRWRFQGKSGILVQIHGLDAPPDGSKRADEGRCRLMFLVLGNDVFVRQVHGCTDQILVCDVEFSGRNLTEHIPEFAARENSVSSEAVDPFVVTMLEGELGPVKTIVSPTTDRKTRRLQCSQRR